MPNVAARDRFTGFGSSAAGCGYRSAMSDPRRLAKRAAAREAVAGIAAGARVGLGTGSTVEHLLELLAERVRAERLEVVGVPTSDATAARARELGIPLTTLDETPALDVAIDGADEIDPDRNLIKGGGGALTREKIVAASAKRFWIIADERKLVPYLGATFRLPVEVLRFGRRQTARRIADLGLEPSLRERDGEPFVTDNGNAILDCALGGPVAELGELADALARIPGVVEHGLFLGMAERVFVGAEDGSAREL
jgi:ribose 5-phosphate isomerase A